MGASLSSPPPRPGRWGPWLAALGLALIYDAPLLLLDAQARPSAEPWLLLAVYALARRHGVLRLAGWVLWPLVALLVLYRIDRVGFLRFLGAEPLLYDQLFMARHLMVLISDLWSWSTLAIVAAVIAALVLALFAARALLHRFARVLEPEQWGRQRWVLLAVSLVALVGTWVPWPGGSPVQSAGLGLADNLARSVRLYRNVHRSLGAEPYRELRGVELTERPDVHLLLVESYGRFAFEHPELGREHAHHLAQWQQDVRAGGWHVVSGFSRSPVLGGRSWLAEASVLMGTEVRYEAVFRHLVDNIERVPNLVSFLSGQGYTTLLLAPADRARPGVEEVDYYGYDRIVRFDDLGYRGPRMGWGIIPDQFSLGFVRDHVMPGLRRPLFFNFHMVSSHAPWLTVPRVKRDWEDFNRWGRGDYANREKDELRRRLQRYVRKGRATRYAEGDSVARRYLRAIHYELDVIDWYLRSVGEGAVVIVMGDHQPPFVSSDNSSLDVPVHVFARDPRWLLELRERGLSPGLELLADAPRVMRHEGLLSALVRTLARGGHAATDVASLPPFRPLGVSLGVRARDATGR